MSTTPDSSGRSNATGPAAAAHLIDNAAGACRVLPGGAAYCTGIVPHDGFEVVRVQLDPWLPLDEAYPFIENHLANAGRPIQALCGIEIRQPGPLTRDRWAGFNVPYLAQLRRWGLMHGDSSLVCRSNIALAVAPPSIASVCAFSFTRPATSRHTSFCLSGTADIDPQGNIIAEGDTSPAAMRQRARYTIDVIGSSLAQLGLSWQDTSQIAIFHVHDIPDLWGPSLLGATGEALRRGVLVYRARPPIAGGEVELEARGVRHETVVSTR